MRLLLVLLLRVCVPWVYVVVGAVALRVVAVRIPYFYAAMCLNGEDCYECCCLISSCYSCCCCGCGVFAVSAVNSRNAAANAVAAVAVLIHFYELEFYPFCRRKPNQSYLKIQNVYIE